MSVLISTTMYNSDNFSNILHFIDKYDGKVGAEIFPRFDEPEFEGVLINCLPKLKKVPISIHEPYWEIEHTADFHSKQYRITMHRLSSMIKYGSVLGCRYIVYHHNNCAVAPEDKERLLKVSEDNLQEVTQLLLPYGIKVAVENAGTKAEGTMLLDEDEFIAVCRENVSNVVIDLGHINANGWNLRKVVNALQRKIVAYHIHNNYGEADEHNRILDGTLDFGEFLNVYKEFTPDADLVLEYSNDFADNEDAICEDIDYIYKALS